MDLITDDLHRALAFLHACTSAGGFPTADELDLYITSKQPRNGESASTLYQAAIRNMQALVGTTWIPGEPVSGYLLSVGWAEQMQKGNFIHLTKLGTALFRGIADSDAELSHEVTVQTASPDNPISLAQIVNLIQTKQSELFVDPYLGFEEIDKLRSAGIRKILTTRRHLTAGIQDLVATLGEAEKVEIKVANQQLLHDRAIIHRNGGVALVGTSFNGRRKPYTSLVDLPPSIGAPIKNNIDMLWAQSEPLENLVFTK